MIIQQAVSAPVITSINNTPTKFKIKASAKAFKILSGFYSEPILAIPRELGANAWDAHVKAKNTNKMFEVHAPNQLEPWFSIRDFGTGLSPTDIDQIYTTYFESTKTNDNDSDGCMGLGSKTPYNYTENFSVISFYNGVKHVYNCFIDEAGSPNIMAVMNEPTKEHNGMEIKFGVKLTDVAMFVEKIQRAYDPFRFRPIIVGASVKFNPRVYSFENSTSWGMRKNNEDRYTSNVCRAFMGNYSYPISYDALRSYIDNLPNDKTNKNNKIYSLLQDGHFDFFFDIGDLEVAPNKEQLQYDADNKTAKAIVDRVFIAIKELVVLVNKSLEVPKTRWEAMSLHAKYNSYNGLYSSVRRVIGDITVKFNGEVIGSSSISANKVNVNLKLTKPSDDHYNPNKLPQKFTMNSLAYRENSDKFIVRNDIEYSVPETGAFPIFLYTGEDSIKKARVRHYLKGKFAGKSIPTSILICDQSPNFKVFKAHCEYLGIPDTAIVNIEELPKPPRVARGTRTIATDEINYSSFGDGNQYVHWSRKSEKFEPTGTYYYVDFYYSTPTWRKDSDISTKISPVLFLLNESKVIPSTHKIFYGINKKNKHMLTVGTWINIFDLAEIEAKKKQEEIEHTVYLSGLGDKISSIGNVRRVISTPSFIKTLENKKTIEMFSGFAKLGTEIQSASSSQTILLDLFKFKAKCHKTLPVDLVEFKELLNNKYMRVFDLIDSYSNSLTGVAKIINFIDEKS